MIQSVTIQNFKNIRDQTIELDRLTVFVGPNASGKTSVLYAIQIAEWSATGGPKGVFVDDRHCDWLYTRGGCGDLSIACTTDGGRFTVRAVPPDGHPPLPDLMGNGDWSFYFSHTDGTRFEDVVYKPALPLEFLRLDATELAKPSYSDSKTPYVEPKGEGLASVLAYLALNDPDGFDELVALMRDLIPQIKRIRFRRASIKRKETELVRFGDDIVERQMTRSYQGEEILFDFRHANNVAAHTLSEGTLLLLGLITVLLGPNRPKILLLDDIERGLHPLAQKTLLEAIGRIMERFPDLQILATAHSPYLLDHMRTDQIRLMATGDDGYAHCGRLEDHPLFDQWKDEMAPGELWSLFGESWVAGREATP